MNADDPRIAAWALDEGTPAERAAVEAALAADPALRAEAEAMRAAAGALRDGLAAEPVPALDPAHRGALEAALSGAPAGSAAPPATARFLRVSPEFGAVAATLLLTLGLAIGGVTGAVEFGADAERPRDPAGLFGSRGVPAAGAGNQGDEEFVFVSNFGQSTVTRVRRSELGDGQLSTEIFESPRFSSDHRAVNERLGVAGSGSGGPGGGKGGFTGQQWEAGEYSFGGGGGGGASAFVAPNLILKPGVTVATTGTLPADIVELKRVRLGDVTSVDELKSLGYLSPGESTTESFSPIVENAWVRPLGEAALSTFSIDVDTAAYSIVRRCVMEQNRLPPPGALRIEELVNYFPYAYEGPTGSDPFAVHLDAASCPWQPRHRLVRVVLQGRRVEEAERPAANLVFLLDVSGSMAQPNKLPLVKQSIAMLAGRLTARDRVAMVVYAGSSGLVLPPTPGDRKAEILAALERLGAGGSTNGAAGIEQAYQVAAENFVQGGINRVVLATDGDFNVGVSDPSALVKMIEEKAKSGVFLTALGYGMDNLQDATLEQLADRGNGNYGYVDGLNEARKVLVDQGMGTLHAIAKDVKIQVEFNPARVAAFRLLGYENRVLAAQDFADDRKDAGEIGAGHAVTAFYEVVPAGEPVPGAAVDALRYQRPADFSGSVESLVVKLRWKEPEGDTSTLREVPFVDANLAFDAADPDFRFAASVAAFGMALRGSEHRGSATLGLVRGIAAGALADDPGGWRGEFLALVDRAASLAK